MIVAIILDERNIKQYHQFEHDYELEYFLQCNPNCELMYVEETDNETSIHRS